VKYVVLLALLGLIGWTFYQRIRRKLRSLRGEPEPEYRTPRNVKLLAAAIVAIYGLWIILRLYRNF